MTTQYKKLLLILIPVCVAYLQSPGTAKNRQEYAVASVDANYYYILENVTDKEAGIDYLCNSYDYTVCTIHSFMEPDELGRIGIYYAWPTTFNAIYLPLDFD